MRQRSKASGEALTVCFKSNLFLNNSTIEVNTSIDSENGGHGGGIHSEGSSITLDSLTFINNSAHEGVEPL